MQLFRTLQCFFKKNKIFFDPKKVKKLASKVAHNRPRPFYSTVQPRPQPTAQNWFSILWNLGTRHLFSYLCAECTALTSLTITLIGLWQKTTLITIRRYSSCALLNLAECYRIRKLELCLPKACQNINLAWIEPGWGCQRKLLVFSVLLPSNS